MLKRLIENIIGLIFIISGVIKYYDFDGTADFIISATGFNYDLIRNLLPVLIVIEIYLGISFCINIWRTTYLFCTIFLIIIFFILINFYFLLHNYSNCGCFGTRVPSTPFSSIIKNIIIALYMLSAKRRMNKLNMAA